MDLRHTEAIGTLQEVRVKDGAKRAELDFETENEEFEGMETWRFGFSQLLKFASLRKGDLKDGEGEVIPDAGKKVLENIDENQLVFKISEDEKVIAVVSPDFVSIPTGEVKDIAQQVITEKGISDFEIKNRQTRSRLVDAFDVVFTNEEKEVEEVGDTLNGGLSFRNSSFGASSLRVNRYYLILACSNGMMSRQSGSEFRQVHMGDAQDLRESVRNEIDAQIDALWEQTDLIERAHGLNFPIEEQLEFLNKLAGEGKITKRSASTMAGKILFEAGEDRSDYEDEYEDLSIPETEPNGGTWNTGEGNVWSFVNAFTGFSTHSELSSESTLRQIERVYNDVMNAEDRDEIAAIAE